MLKVNFPNIDCNDPYETCIKSVSKKHDDYIIRMTNISQSVAVAWSDFSIAVANKSFYQIESCSRGDVKQIIAGGVKKSELKALYEIHMLKKGSDARKIYDILRASAPKCPLCGIRNVKTLDHYLPKSRYPLLSVNPENLVPACSECNTVKLDKIFVCEQDQTLYPYNEASNFYDEDWTSANVNTFAGELVFEFYADPPATWTQVDQQRAKNHFDAFNLEEAFGVNTISFSSFVTDSCKELWDAGGINLVESWCNRGLKSKRSSTHQRAIYRAILGNMHLCNEIT